MLNLVNTIDIIKQIDNELRSKLEEIVGYKSIGLMSESVFPLDFVAGKIGDISVASKYWENDSWMIFGETKSSEPAEMNSLIKLDFYNLKELIHKVYESAEFNVLTLKDINNGVLRQYNRESISGGLYGLRDADVMVERYDGTYFEPMPPEIVPSALEYEMRDYYQTIASGDDFAILVSMLKLYVNIGIIHLFNDGNGRTDRLLLEFLLLQNGYKLPIIYDLEDLFVQNETALERIVDDSSKAYDDGKDDYALPVISDLATLILDKYRALAKNYEIAKTNNVNPKDANDALIYFIAINDEFTDDDLLKWWDRNHFDKHKLGTMNKLLDAGYLEFTGGVYKRKPGTEYKTLREKLADSKSKLSL